MRGAGTTSLGAGVPGRGWDREFDGWPRDGPGKQVGGWGPPRAAGAASLMGLGQRI